MNFARGQCEVVPEETFVLDPARLRKAVRRAGFKIGEVHLVISAAIESGRDNHLVRLSAEQEVPVLSSTLADRLAQAGQSARILFRVTLEDKDRFSLEAIEFPSESGQ